jgi:hypothetical protein
MGGAHGGAEVGVLLRDPATATRLAEYFDGLERSGGLVRG